MEYQSGTPYPAYMPQGMVNDGRRWEPPQYPSQYPAPPQRTSRTRIVAFAVGLVLAVAAGILLWRFVLSPNFATSNMPCWTSRDFTLGGQEYKFLESRVSDLQQHGWEIAKGKENTLVYDSFVYQGDEVLIVGNTFAQIGMKHASLMPDPEKHILSVLIYNPYNDAVICEHCIVCGLALSYDEDNESSDAHFAFAGIEPFQLDAHAIIDSYGEPNSPDPYGGLHYYAVPDDQPSAYETPVNNIFSCESIEEWNDPPRTTSDLKYFYYENNNSLMMWCKFHSQVGHNIQGLKIEFGTGYTRRECAHFAEEGIPQEVVSSTSVPDEATSQALQQAEQQRTAEAEELKAKAAEAAAWLPSRWEEGAFVLDGTTYKMGESTIGEILQGGWMLYSVDATRLSQDDNAMIDPRDLGGYVSLTLLRPEGTESIKLTGENFDSVAHHYTECVVTSISASAATGSWNFDAPFIVIPGGGYIGMPKDDFIAIYGTYEHYTKNHTQGSIEADYPNRFPDEVESFAWSGASGPKMTVTFDKDDHVSAIQYR